MRNIKGGYQIINFKNAQLESGITIIKGIYESIENSHRKPLLFSGLLVQSDYFKVGDIFVSVSHATINSKNAYYAKIFNSASEGAYLIINEDDEVYISNTIE